MSRALSVARDVLFDVSPRALQRVRTPRAWLPVLSLLALACAGGDAGPASSELVAPSSDAADAAPCQRPRGSWRIHHEVSDASGACVLLLRDRVRDFDAPGGDPDCTSTMNGPFAGCTFREEQRCHGLLGGSRFESLVSREFVLVSGDRLEGSGSARGSSADLGVCQMPFVLTGTPD